MSGYTRLLGDIGATHARLALLMPDGGIAQEKTLQIADYERFSDVIAAYLKTLSQGERPKEAAFGIAAPIVGDQVQMTNATWRFSLNALKAEFGWSHLHAVNDFAANALAVPHLDSSHVVQIGSGGHEPGHPIAVLGPGTGLGVAALIPSGKGRIAVAGEGGHVTLAASDSREAAVIDIVRRQYAHVSAERLLSGPGLVTLYDALRELAGKPAVTRTPEHITHLYPGCDPFCRETVTMFCAMLGTFAGNVALTYSARGGVYLMGGVIPKIIDFFSDSQFRERFEFKGRYGPYLARIATTVVMQPVPAFLGLKTLFDGETL
jgi:glucokinase